MDIYIDVVVQRVCYNIGMQLGAVIGRIQEVRNY